MQTVTATLREAGNIEVTDGERTHEYKVALLLSFDSVEDLKAAMTATKNIRVEWCVADDSPVPEERSEK